MPSGLADHLRGHQGGLVHGLASGKVPDEIEERLDRHPLPESVTDQLRRSGDLGQVSNTNEKGFYENQG